jgi:serine protease Do
VVERLTPGATVPVLLQRRGAPVFLAIDVPTRR